PSQEADRCALVCQRGGLSSNYREIGVQSALVSVGGLFQRAIRSADGGVLRFCFILENAQVRQRILDLLKRRQDCLLIIRYGSVVRSFGLIGNGAAASGIEHGLQGGSAQRPNRAWCVQQRSELAAFKPAYEAQGNQWKVGGS